MITYLKKLTDERDSLTTAATDLAEKAASEERDLTDTEQASLTAWQTRCAAIDAQLTEYNAQAESQRAYARLRESLTHVDDEPEHPNGKKPAPVETRGWGDLFLDSPQFQNYQGSGTSGRVTVPFNLETRAEITTTAIPFNPTYSYSPVERSYTTPLLNAIGKVTVGANTVEWIEWQPSTVPAAPIVAEAAAKPEMALTAVPHSDTLDTYAHWKGITRQALEDIPQIRSIVEGRLRQGISRALENGAVAALEAGTYVGAVNADLLTAIRLAQATVQSSGYPANVAVLNPNDLATIDLSLMGTTLSGPTLTTSAWGLQFIPVTGVDAGTAYVGDLDAALQMFGRGSATVYMTDSHADYFIKNIVLILAETRALFAVTEPLALSKASIV